MSYHMQRGYGQVDNVQCGPGEEFDLTSMTCVTAGQATRPLPSLPTTVPTLPSAPGPAPTTLPPAPTTAPPVAAASMATATPWIVLGALAVVGAVLLAKS